MNRNKLAFMLKGSARLLDIGSSINKKNNNKTISEEAYETIAQANHIVSSILFANICKQIERQKTSKNIRRPVERQLKLIEDRVAELRKKVERVKSSPL